MHTNVVRALVDVVATKLGIILLSFFLLPSTYFPPRRDLPTIFNLCMPLLVKIGGGTLPSTPKSSFMGGQQAF